MSSVARTNTDYLLEQARRYLDAADGAGATQMAARAVQASAHYGDIEREARAHLLLCRAYVHQSQMTLARTHGMRASDVFRLVGDADGEIAALTQTSYACSSLDQTTEASALAQTAVTLAQRGAQPRQLTQALNYLGVASFWAGTCESAADTLGSAVALAHAADDPSMAFQPLVNQCFALFLELAQSSSPADVHKLNRLSELLHRGHTLASEGRLLVFNRETQDIGLYLLTFIRTQLHLFSGDLYAAHPLLAEQRASVQRLPRASWLRALNAWSHAKAADCAGDGVKALSWAMKMLDASVQGQHNVVNRTALSVFEQVQAAEYERLLRGVSSPRRAALRG